jgi:ComF family protein
MQALIHELKFTRNRHMAKPLARLLAEQMPYFTEAPIITHIPTATSRRRMRGYDQAELLAVELARLTGYRHVGLLRREGQQRQVGAHRQTRIEQLRGALRPIRASMINQAEIIIVDDVMTTGATLTAAAETLKDAGAKQLHGLVLAQKS